jgi:hypothetical protein
VQPDTAPQAVREQAAIDTLQQSLTAYGAGASAVSDLTATGTMTRFVADDVKSAPVSLKWVRGGNSRLDAEFEGLPQTVLVAFGFAQTLDRERKPRFYPGNATAFGLITNPSWRIAALLNDLTIDLKTTTGSVDSTEKSPQISITSSIPKNAVDTGVPEDRQASSVQIDIDPQSMLITKLTTTVTTNQNAGPQVSYAIVFDDYRRQGETMIPFSISEIVGGQKTWTITLDTVATNTGLTDSDFSN